MNIYNTVRSLEVVAKTHLNKLSPTEYSFWFLRQYPQQIELYRRENQ